MKTHGIFSTPQKSTWFAHACSAKPPKEQQAQYIRQCLDEVAAHAIAGCPAAGAKRVMALETATEAAAKFLRRHGRNDVAAVDLLLERANLRLADARAIGVVYGALRTSSDLAFLPGRQTQPAKRRWGAALRCLESAASSISHADRPQFQRCLQTYEKHEHLIGRCNPEALRSAQIASFTCASDSGVAQDRAAMHHFAATSEALQSSSPPTYHRLFGLWRPKQVTILRAWQLVRHDRPCRVPEVLAAPALAAKLPFDYEMLGHLAEMRAAAPKLTDASWATLVERVAQVAKAAHKNF